MEIDLGLWGIFAMPVGLFICFAPALLVWIRLELAARSSKDQAPRS